MAERKSNPLTDKLLVVYGAPDSGDQVAYIAEYARITNKYKDDELAAAAERIFASRKAKTWPSIGECVAALEDNRAETYARNRPELKILRDPYPEWSPAAFTRANQLVQCEMGRKAAREGWILGLHDYCRNHGKLPTSTHEIIETSRFIDRVAAGVGKVNAEHMKMAASFIKKRNELADMVLGGAR